MSIAIIYIFCCFEIIIKRFTASIDTFFRPLLKKVCRD